MREKLFSLTRDDFEWDYFRAGGKGGQKQNKTSTGVRVKHAPSRTSAESREGTDQKTNRKLAFRKITSDPKFTTWLKITAAKFNGISTPEEIVEKLMKQEEDFKIEVKENGKWIEV